MTWTTIEEASKTTPKRTLQRRIQKNEIPSHICPETKKRMVWLNEPVEIAHRREREKWALLISDLTNQISELHSGMSQLTARVALLSSKTDTSKEKSKNAKVAPTKKQAQSRLMPGQQLQLLQWIKHSWNGSQRAFERAAGLSHGFITKARKGLRSGPRSSESWKKIERFINSQKREAA